MKLKYLCTSQGIFIQMRSQTTKRVKIFTSYASNRGSVSEIYKNLQILNVKKERKKERENELNYKIRPQNKTEWSLKMKYNCKVGRQIFFKCSSSLAIRKVQINITLKFYLTKVRVHKIRQKQYKTKKKEKQKYKNTGNKADKFHCGLQRKQNNYYCCCNCHLMQPLWNSCGHYLKL